MRADRACLARTTDTSEDTFRGFPRRTLLETGDVPIEQLALLALREGQHTNPLYRVHRWFARRLGSQFRGVLAALTLPEGAEAAFWNRYFERVLLDGAVVFDPFTGGGTAVVEASRCGAQVIGFDIDPVAALIVRFELAAAARGELTDATRKLCEDISARVLPLHATWVAGEEHQVLHHFWVELRTCGSCQQEFDVHPHYRLAYDKKKERQWVFCRKCYEVQELALRRKELRCEVACGTRTRIDAGTLQGGKVSCPHCRFTSKLSSRWPEA